MGQLKSRFEVNPTLRSINFIAEIGVNHNGSHELLELMTRSAVSAGADAVKYQLFDPVALVSRAAEMAEYQSENLRSNISQQEMLKPLVVSEPSLRHCKSLCDELEVEFICTAFDEASLLKVVEIGARVLKWPSGELDNLPFLAHAASFGLPMIISTGMASTDEVGEALEVCFAQGLSKSDIVLLQCTSQYPAPAEHANIFSIPFMMDEFGVATGYSDHTVGDDAGRLAVAAGACMFEKHITLSKFMNGPDHKASAEISEFAEYVQSLKNASDICGSYKKECSVVEMDTRNVARKSLHLTRDVSCGEVITQDMLLVQRPGDGISGKEIDSVIGCLATKDMTEGHKLSSADYERL